MGMFQCALVAALATVATCVSPHLLKQRSLHMQRMRGEVPPTAVLPNDRFIAQTLDHFDVLNSPPSTNWLQRYWVNESFWQSGSNAPVFLYVEGEGAGSPLDVVQGQHVELAAAHGALVVALEHRYYGASNPTPDMSVDNMRFLSSHQAIADVATFITMYLTPMYNLSGSNQIVTFGGSYPGALSAWIRLRLPHLVSVAFSTSSPVLAQLDFTGYNDVVAASMSDPAVGGSQACLAALTTAFVAIDGALRGTPAQQAAMAKQMYSCAAPGSLDDIKLLAGNLAGVVMGVVQYNDDGTQPIDIAGMCNILTQNGVGAVNAFAQVINATLSGAPCMDNSYADFIAQVGNTTVDPTVTGVGMRQWSWEICSQFGLYQTCEVNTQCPFSSLMDLASQLKICTDAFDARMTPALNQAGVDFTNAYLGGKTLDTDRILFTNGLVDPWHALSVLPSENNNATNAALLIPTGSHCRQMFPSSPNDSPDVIAARVAAASILKGWLTN